jgi:hypothetical protein
MKIQHSSTHKNKINSIPKTPTTGLVPVVVFHNFVQPPNEWPCHARRILNPLLMTATAIGASVRHTDKLVIVVKWVYILIVNVFMLFGPGVCIYDIMNVIVCGLRLVIVNKYHFGHRRGLFLLPQKGGESPLKFVYQNTDECATHDRVTEWTLNRRIALMFIFIVYMSLATAGQLTVAYLDSTLDVKFAHILPQYECEC